MDTSDHTNLLQRIDRLNAIGIALSAEKDTTRLLENILLGIKEITRADGGSLYIMNEGHKQLQIEIIRTDSLQFAMGGTTGKAVPFPPINLYLGDGSPNLNMVVTCSVLQDRTINIEDAYTAEEFDFSGTRKFDSTTGYRSTSFLTIPMKNHENETIGVLQLINAIDPDTGEVTAFSAEDQHLAESLASQAAVALTNKRLIDDLKHLFDSFVKLIATAIDEKSPYTGGHCRRVPELTMMLAEAAHRTQEGPLGDFVLNNDDRYALEVAGWLHDCGKITTPEFVMDKSTKLETIYDRIHTVDARFEVLRRDAEIEKLRAVVTAMQEGAGQAAVEAADASYLERIKQLDDDQAFLKRSNVGGEFMQAEHQQRVERIGKYQWRNSEGELQDFLTEDEIKNLQIPKGTLTDAEREVIQHHIVATIKMLEALPFPKQLQKVPEYAGGHHERMDGKGYPRGLTREQMSVPARVMAIADIFEALTDGNRPYKKAMSLSLALKILNNMKNDQHIDPDLYEVFIKEKVYMQYAEKFMSTTQIDEVNPDALLN